jgi:hypothetical protein
MYRRTLALLWSGTIIFGAAAALDVFIDFMKNAQGILIGGWAMMFVGAILYAGLHKLNETARANGAKGGELQVDVDKLRGQVGGLDGKVEEVREWQEASTLIEEASHPPTPPEPDREPCPIYQLRIRGKHGREAIVGKRTPDPIDPAIVWSAIEEGGAGTLPGTSAS